MGCNPQESLENTINTMGTPNYTTTERVYQKVPRFVPLVHWSLRLFYSRSPCLEAQALGNLPEWNIEMERWRCMNMHEDMKIWRCSSWELGSEVTWWCIHKLWKKCWETSEFVPRVLRKRACKGVSPSLVPAWLKRHCHRAFHHKIYTIQKKDTKSKYKKQKRWQ